VEVRNSEDPVWEFCCEFSVPHPTLLSLLRLEVYDHNDMFGDASIGTCRMAVLPRENEICRLHRKTDGDEHMEGRVVVSIDILGDGEGLMGPLNQKNLPESVHQQNPESPEWMPTRQGLISVAIVGALLLGLYLFRVGFSRYRRRKIIGAGPDAFNRHFDEAVQVVPKWPPPRLPPLPLNSEHADDAKTIDSPLSRKP